MALSASCHFIPPDQVTVLLPVVEEKLKHSSVSRFLVMRECSQIIFDPKKLKLLCEISGSHGVEYED
jgi:hypothetical protein